MKRYVWPLLMLLLLSLGVGIPRKTNLMRSASAAQIQTEKTEVKVWMNTEGGVYHCPATRRYVGTTKQEQDKKDKDECHPWQEKDEHGNCVDKPGTHHYHGHHDPEPGEQCWDECLCDEGQSPSGDSCAPCSYEGTVCTPE